MSWQGIAERAAQAWCASIRDRIEAAVAAHAPDAQAERTADGVRLRGRGLKALWISEAGLRFARRTGT